MLWFLITLTDVEGFLYKMIIMAFTLFNNLPGYASQLWNSLIYCWSWAMVFAKQWRHFHRFHFVTHTGFKIPYSLFGAFWEKCITLGKCSHSGNDCFATLFFKHGYCYWKWELFIEDPTRSYQDGEGLTEMNVVSKMKLRELGLCCLDVGGTSKSLPSAIWQVVTRKMVLYCF